MSDRHHRCSSTSFMTILIAKCVAIPLAVLAPNPGTRSKFHRAFEGSVELDLRAPTRLGDPRMPAAAEQTRVDLIALPTGKADPGIGPVDDHAGAVLLIRNARRSAR